MPVRWQRELPQLALLLLMLALSGFVWRDTPDRLPVHWNLWGEVDRYGGKVEALLLVPGIALVMYALLLLAPRLSRTNEARLGTGYTATRWAVLILLAAIHGLLVLQVYGVQIDMLRAILLLVGALFLVLGSSLGSVQPNAIMGVRTPWTLTSRAAWEASQRLGGRLFLAAGGMFILAGLLAMAWLTLAAVAFLLVGVVALIWYGYRVCQADPERLPPGRTLLS